MPTTIDDLHIHVHIDGGATAAGINELKELIMVTKDELLTQLDEVKALATETASDVTRVLEALEAAVANADLTAVATSVSELRSIVEGADAALEAAVPETEPEPEPTP